AAPRPDAAVGGRGGAGLTAVVLPAAPAGGPRGEEPLPRHRLSPAGPAGRPGVGSRRTGRGPPPQCGRGRGRSGPGWRRRRRPGTVARAGRGGLPAGPRGRAGAGGPSGPRGPNRGGETAATQGCRREARKICHAPSRRGLATVVVLREWGRPFRR